MLLIAFLTAVVSKLIFMVVIRFLSAFQIRFGILQDNKEVGI